MDLSDLSMRYARALSRMALDKLRHTIRHRGRGRTAPAPEIAREEPPRDEFIDARELARARSIAQLNETAEQYFRGLTDWDYHLAKPFSSVADAPALLINFANVLQCLKLYPGLRVLDFGAGSGWTSRLLTQLGCEVVVADVSPTALEMARELYRRQPVIGQQPEPAFLRFDGRRIDLADCSIDRILCFDAFHHAPNPDEVLAEFARVLTPGGIAAFSEPGPNHSRTAQSQFEMRMYGVLESDVDVRSIWRSARAAGFSDARFAAYNIPPFHVGLDEFEEVLRGGVQFIHWSQATREFLQNVRIFALIKGGSPPLDSRSGDGVDAKIDLRIEHVSTSGIKISGTVENKGRATWLRSAAPVGGVCLGCHLLDASGRLINFDLHWEQLSAAAPGIASGERVDVSFSIPKPPPGEYILEFDCVAQKVCWFAQRGSQTVRLPVSID